MTKDDIRQIHGDPVTLVLISALSVAVGDLRDDSQVF